MTNFLNEIELLDSVFKETDGWLHTPETNEEFIINFVNK